MTEVDEASPEMAKVRHEKVVRFRAGAFGRTATLVGLWLAPLLAVVIAVPLQSVLDRASVEPPNPITVSVGSRQVDRAIAVNALVTSQTPPELRSGADGVVTGLVEAGPLETGQRVFEIDGAGVLAYRGSVLYRDLARGDHGPDVSSVSKFLVTIGLLDSRRASDQFGPAMETAVRGLQARAGVNQDGIFRLGYITYVPNDATTIDQAIVGLGDRVSVGDAIFVAAAPVESVTLTPVSAGSLATYNESDLALRIGDDLVDIPGVDMTGSDAQAVADSLEEGVSEGEIRVDATGGVTAVYSGGILVLRDPIVSGVVPSTAVVIDEDGAACVLVQTDSGTKPLIVERPVAGNEVGTVTIDQSAIGLTVVRDASRAARTPVECE